MTSHVPLGVLVVAGLCVCLYVVVALAVLTRRMRLLLRV